MGNIRITLNQMGIPREPRFGRGLRRDYTRAPQISKAYLVGLLHDSTTHKTTYRIAQKNVNFLKFISEQMSLLDIRSWIYKEGKLRNVWILEFSRKFLDGTGIITREDKLDYLRGYFDAEGGIAKSPSVRFYLYYCQKNRRELEQIKSYLDEIEIESGEIHNPSWRRDPDFWRFYIRANSYSKFAKIVGSSHPDKINYLRMKI